jgi:hypothetical protein
MAVVAVATALASIGTGATLVAAIPNAGAAADLADSADTLIDVDANKTTLREHLVTVVDQLTEMRRTFGPGNGAVVIALDAANAALAAIA